VFFSPKPVISRYKETQIKSSVLDLSPVPLLQEFSPLTIIWNRLKAHGIRRTAKSALFFVFLPYAIRVVP
jgi:hypothetical protein